MGWVAGRGVLAVEVQTLVAKVVSSAAATIIGNVIVPPLGGAAASFLPSHGGMRGATVAVEREASTQAESAIAIETTNAGMSVDATITIAVEGWHPHHL